MPHGFSYLVPPRIAWGLMFELVGTAWRPFGKIFRTVGKAKVLTGESGLGKTTLMRTLVQALNPNQYHPLYLDVAKDWTTRTLYRQLAYDLNLPIPHRPLETQRAVRQALWTETTQHGRLPVIVLDESHWLAPAVLQALRVNGRGKGCHFRPSGRVNEDHSRTAVAN